MRESAEWLNRIRVPPAAVRRPSVGLLVAFFACVVLVVGAGSVKATIGVPCGDVAELRAAIVAANASSGADTISLIGACSYDVVDEYQSGTNEAFPMITGDITIQGNGSV